MKTVYLLKLAYSLKLGIQICRAPPNKDTLENLFFLVKESSAFVAPLLILD